jgi:hypothetical protein
MLVIAIGDVHAPWIYWRTVDRICERVESTRSTKNVHLVQLGDLYDMYSWSRFPRTHSLYTPLQELKKGREVTDRLWERLRKANPKAKCWQLRGNHDVRPYKRVLEKMPETEPLIGIDQLWRFEGVETILDETDDLILGRVSYTHGFTKFGGHVAYTGRNTVTGHLHRGGVTTMRVGSKTLWEANAGLCGNAKAVPLSYGQLRRYNTTTQGWVEVDVFGPRFIGTANP